MAAFLVITFLVIFALVLLATGLGLRVLEAQRKKQVAGILHRAAEDEAVTTTTVLRDATASEDIAARLLARFQFTKKMDALIQQAGLDWSAGGLLIVMFIMAAAGAFLGSNIHVLVLPALSIIALAFVLGFLPYLYLRHKRTNRLAQFEEQFPEALDFLARSMRAGHAFSVGLEMLADESPEPLANEFRRTFNEHNLGAPMDVSLKGLAERVPLVDVRFFVSAVRLQHDTGGNLAEILTKLSYVIRERFRLKGQVKAASSHGRMTGLVLTLMPIVLTVALMIMAPEYLKSLVHDPDGKYLILGAILGQLLGYFFIRRIINIKV